MQNFLKMRASKLLVGAALAGLGFASTASASLLVDVRAISVSNSSGNAVLGSKAVTLGAGDTVTVGIFLSGLETETGGSNGLGSFNVSVRSLGESPAATIVQATGSTNGQTNPPFDFAYSQGSIQDSTIATDTDTDNDALSISGTQLDGGSPYTTGIGNGTEVSLGTATFTAQSTGGTVNLNTYFNGSGGTLGGIIVKALDNLATDDTNGTSGSNLATAAKLGTNVAVTVVVPEPASIGLLGLAATGLIRRRRQA